MMIVEDGVSAELVVGCGGLTIRCRSVDGGGATVELGTGGLEMVEGPDEHPPARATSTTGAAKLARRR